VFVQISDENLHHVREVMDEVFGPDNFVSQIAFLKTSGFETATLATLNDTLLWYARAKSRVKVRKLFEFQQISPGEGNATWLLLADGTYRGVTRAERHGNAALPVDVRLYLPDNLVSQGGSSERQVFEYEGGVYEPPPGSHWKANFPLGMQRLAAAGRIHVARNSIRYRRFATDFAFQEIGNVWTDTRTGNFTDDKLYVVQTGAKVVERCILLCTDPGDLVLDPTCGSGTTAYVAEQWGRRWITIDTSRVPLALARQRLLTATFPWHRLKDEARGPAGGFVYERRQNNRGEEVGGLVPHVTLKSIANDEPPQLEVLVDRPEQDGNVTRVTGPFVVEATIPTPVDWEGDGISDSGVAAAEEHAAFSDRMLEVLRRSPQIQLGGNTTAKFEQVRQPAKAMVLNAEAIVPGTEDRVAFVFGPEHGAVSEQLVHQALKEADRKNYAQLYVVGFAIEPNARQLVESTRTSSEVEAWYVQATPDLIMGSLLKTTRASQLFSVCGLPDVELTKAATPRGEPEKWVVALRGVDVFDPSTMETRSVKGGEVPAWFLDTDYNHRVFRVSQAFFPKTGAWDALKRSLRAEFDESLFDHLAGDTSAAFEAGEHRTIAVKVIDERGNELMVVRPIP
jgi:adenine-specific DNA-methyltransferase